MALKANFDGVKSWKGGILPPGRYVVEIDDAKEGQSSGGYPQLELELRAIGGEHDGGTIADWVVVIDSTMGKVKSIFEAAGVEWPEGEFEIKPDDLKDKQVQIIVREHTWNGEARSKVEAYSPVQGDMPSFEEDPPTEAGEEEKIPF